MIIWVAIRRLLALLVKLLFLNRVVTLGVVGLLVALLVVVPFVSSRVATPDRATVSAAALPAAQARAAAQSGSVTPPHPAVANYVSGMANFNAKLMWDNMGPDAIGQMQQRGATVDRLQQGLDEAKGGGATYDEIQYIGGYNTKDGGGYYFYVVTRRNFSGPNQIEQMFYAFTVGADGKIEKID